MAADPDAVATKVQALVDAVNAALTDGQDLHAATRQGSTAALKGDFSVDLARRPAARRRRPAPSGADGSPAKVGFQLTKDGKVTFDKAQVPRPP